MGILPTIKVAKRDPVVRFLVTAALLYLGWYLFYELVVHPWGRIDHAVIDGLIWTSGTILSALGYALIPEPANAEMIRTIGVEGGSLLWIGDPCNGVSLFAVFLIFLIAYPGPLRHKLWYAPLGLTLIFLVNALRIVALCIIVSIDYELLNFNHDYTFYVVVYGVVLLLWVIWVRRYARIEPAHP
ncbi:MAG: archaeosortase/exosortase family protein [Flavobacteriales bacterium]|nr:archaeosortase/exosortase family protein [Flavobacteriales bacterium]MCB9193646.1 archaeosortase/exosortase family protein [Flavobacteriales bacterium]